LQPLARLLRKNNMIRIALLFIIGIALTLVAVYDWRIAMRITLPIALVMALLIGLMMYQSVHERQQEGAQTPAPPHRERVANGRSSRPEAAQKRAQELAQRELRRQQQAAEERRLAAERSAMIKSFFADNRALIDAYSSSASMCHSGLMTSGRMEDNADCQAATAAKEKLQQAMKALSGISKKELKKEGTTAMWKIEYAENQMNYAYQLSKRR
jgi:hypothetical protein